MYPVGPILIIIIIIIITIIIIIIIIIVVIIAIIFLVSLETHGGCCYSSASYGAVQEVNGIENHSKRQNGVLE